jgi:endo-1,4-beta-xylanase
MRKLTTLILLSALLAAVGSCAKNEPIVPSDNPPGKEVTPDPPTPPVKVVDYDKYALGVLALEAGLKLGVSFTYWEYQLNTPVRNILTRDFTAVTFGNEMKHDAIVQADGSYNFASADEMAGWAKACGNDLFGHTLGWHSQQKRDYLNTVISNAVPNNDASLVQQNWNFETGTLDGFATDGFKAITSLYDVFAGDYAAQAVTDGATLQIDAAIEAGRTYDVSFWAKALAKEGTVKIVTGDGQEVETQVSTAWRKYTVTLSTESVGDFAYRLLVSKHVVIDNIRIIETTGTPSGSFRTGNDLSGELVNDAIGFVYRDWVYKMVEHFDVYGWDVVNETFSDWPVEFRNTQNTDISKNFVWGQYFKSTKDWVDKAFAYATDALARNGKTAVLYLNDYNLETIDAKRKAYCDYVKGNPQVTGVGTQMHLDMVTTKDLKEKVVASLKDLTATGRMVRISELDIKCNDLVAQADLYKFIFQKYLEIVPPAQRGGITIWGINDKDSWVGENNAPLLYRGANYTRKPAFEALYLYLCEVAGFDPYKE